MGSTSIDMRRSIFLSAIAFTYLSSGLEYPKHQYRLEKSYQDLDSDTSDRRLIYIFDDDDEYDYDYEDKSDYKKKKPKYHKDEEDEGYDFAVETFISSKISNFFNLLI